MLVVMRLISVGMLLLICVMCGVKLVCWYCVIRNWWCVVECCVLNYMNGVLVILVSVCGVMKWLFGGVGIVSMKWLFSSCIFVRCGVFL